MPQTSTPTTAPPSPTKAKNGTTASELLTIGLAQIAPVWLQREATLAKVIDYIDKSLPLKLDLIVFGEALVPGYPFWLERTDGAKFNDPKQKALHALYIQQSVDIAAGHLDAVCQAAQRNQVAVYLGIMEKASDRGHSLYCTLVYIDKSGKIGSTHRKLMPTYEERLVWATGDGHGLQVHPLGAFTVGGLNCWENWMPLARAALYGQGEDLHVASWPGGLSNTEQISRFMAREGRSFVVSVCGLMHVSQLPADTPYLADMLAGNKDAFLANGGSCVAGPDGQWLLAPQVGEEGLYTVQIDHQKVREERQNFDPAGHYSRPDVTQLVVDRRRQTTVKFID